MVAHDDVRELRRADEEELSVVGKVSGGRSALVRAELSLLGDYGIYSYEYNRGKISLTRLSMRIS